MTYFTWARLSPVQQQAAQAHQRARGVGIDGMPPSGPGSVFWCVDAAGAWTWKATLAPWDVDHGAELGQPAAAKAQARR